MSLCCGLPLLVLWYFGLARLRKAGARPAWALLVAALLPLPFVALAVYSEGRYIVLNEGLVGAGCDGDSAEIERLVSLGANPNQPEDNGGYALPCAVGNGHVEAARALLRHGADPKLGGYFGVSRDLAEASDDPAMRRLFGFGVRKRNDPLHHESSRTTVLPAVPFTPGTRRGVTLEEAEPMDWKAFEAALRRHHGGSTP